MERCRQDGLNHKFKRPEATVIFHKEIKLFTDDPIYFSSYPDACPYPDPYPDPEKKFTEVIYFKLELKNQRNFGILNSNHDCLAFAQLNISKAKNSLTNTYVKQRTAN